MSRPPEKNEITGIILAGGRGIRMGTVEKGLVPFRGLPLFEHAVRRLLPQVKTLIINANSEQDAYGQAGFPVFPDEPQDYSGPLAGFATGLRHCRTPFLASVPCDTPFFPETLVARLSQALATEDADAAIVVTGEAAPYVPQPVFCLMKRTLLPALESFLKNGGRRIGDWLASLKVAHVHYSDSAPFYNINTAKELERLEKETGHSIIKHINN